MNQMVYTVYDSKTEAYLPPFFMKTKGQAIRAFTDTVNNRESQFWQHPADFTLFEIGEYNEASGELLNHDANIPLGMAIDFKAEEANIKQ